MHRTQNQTQDPSEAVSHLQTKSSLCDADRLKDSLRTDVHSDTEDGHLKCPAGLILKQRYQVVSTLGAGASGKVMECVDGQKGERVAVKVVKKSDTLCAAALSEVSVLQEINSLDDDNRFACVRMLDWFQHEGHVCIVMELLGPSTFDFLRQNHFLPFSLQQIRLVAFQIFRAISFLHRNNLTHTDLKPENILLVGSEKTQTGPSCFTVKVVDFGSATFDHQHHETLVSTRHYRAPEVILGLGWNQSCDVWSLGCVLMEYYLGRTLFPSHDSKEHLAMMEKVLGPIPSGLLQRTRNQQFVKNQQLNWDELSSSNEFIRKHCQPLTTYMRTNSEEEQQLFDLLSCMLEYDVSRRITVEEAVWHRFFSPLRKLKQT
ncbi:dual specificity protein kinase CLK1 [Austrofundulus limnaeus]|uniref:dual-specificity kinase n=1 Tax=Austrofundulus limnaeus TaxID=52670 RepID=A0A2I4D4J9_AUSLI|nr:PREDICTED: dual specificity protein kinase CLK1-like [Austrofundulus limnaeus]